VVKDDNEQTLHKHTAYLWWWSGKLVRMHLIITPDKTAISEIEELTDPAMDFCLLQVFLLHPSRVLAPLVFVPKVYSPLAWLHSAVETRPDATTGSGSLALRHVQHILVCLSN
jgi:hypothetical protein